MIILEIPLVLRMSNIAFTCVFTTSSPEQALRVSVSCLPTDVVRKQDGEDNYTNELQTRVGRVRQCESLTNVMDEACLVPLSLFYLVSNLARERDWLVTCKDTVDWRILLAFNVSSLKALTLFENS